MGKCVECGRKSLFLRVNSDSLCAQCVEAKIGEAEQFILDFSEHIQKALGDTIILACWGQTKIGNQRRECNYVIEHIDDWKSVPYFKEAFERTLVQNGHFKESPLFLRTLFSEHSEPDFEKLFEKLKKDALKVESDCFSVERRAYDYSELFRVVGVSFKNGRKNRQTILRRMRFGDPPFDGDVDIELEKYKFGDRDAVAVYANGEQIGNISEYRLPWLFEHWDDYFCVSEFTVHGHSESGYGIDIRVCFRHNQNL